MSTRIFLNLIPFILITGVVHGQSYSEAENQLRNSLSGQWEWSYTRGNEKGNKYNVTPKSMNMTVQYLFNRDSVSIFINKNLNEKYSYFFSADTLIYGQEKVLFELSSKKDSLFLKNSSCCDDIFEKLFLRDLENP